MFVRVSDEAVTDPVPTKETVVLPLTVDVPVDPVGGVVSGTGDASNGDVWVQAHFDGSSPVAASLDDP